MKGDSSKTWSSWLGAVGDLRALKKRFLVVTALGCSVFTAMLFSTGPGTVFLAFLLIVLANVCFSLGENFCASFLPEISTRENAGRISGYGWGFGYFGGFLSLGLALLIMEAGGREDPEILKWVFPMTGVFFVLAALPTFFLLRERAVPRVVGGVAGRAFGEGWRQVWRTLHEVRGHRTLAKFLLAMLVYISGLSAVISFAAVYAENVIGFDETEILGLFALLQVSSAAGAFGFGYLHDKIGPKQALMISLAIWTVVCGGAALAATKMAYVVVSCMAGLVLGSTQSGSRAVVSTLTPEGRQGEFFGFWGLTVRLSTIIGPVVFAFMADWLDYRTAVAVNGVFFIVGMAMLGKLKLEEANGRAS